MRAYQLRRFTYSPVYCLPVYLHSYVTKGCMWYTSQSCPCHPARSRVLYAYGHSRDTPLRIHLHLPWADQGCILCAYVHTDGYRHGAYLLPGWHHRGACCWYTAVMGYLVLALSAMFSLVLLVVGLATLLPL